MTREEAKEITKATRDRFEKTRDIQWKLNVAIWTLISSAIYLFAKEPSIRIGFKNYLIALILLFGLIHVIFIYIVQRSLETGTRIEKYIYNKLNENNSTLQEFEVDIGRLTKFWKLSIPGLFWFLFQISSTIFLLLIFLHVNKK